MNIGIQQIAKIRTADEELIEFSMEVLREHAPLEAGYFLREMGYNLPIALDAIKKASERIGLKRNVYISSMVQRAMSYGFDASHIEMADKLEIVDLEGLRIISLRNRFNTVISQKREE